MKSLRDQLLGALVGLARASESKEISDSAGMAFVDGLAMAFPKSISTGAVNASPHEITAFTPEMCLEGSDTNMRTPHSSGAADTLTASDETILAMIDRLHEEKNLMAPDCAACQYPCGRTFDYDMDETYDASEALREAKLHLFAALGELATQAPANESKEVRQFLSDALFQISCTYTPEQLSEPLKRAAAILANSGC